jgi:hypothetical protein
MKEYSKQWANADFENMCWHDNHIHGIRIRNPKEGYDFDIVFDLDYILEWITVGSFFQFVVAPATLTFHGAHKVRFDVTLNFKQSLDIERVDRDEITNDAERKAGYRKWLFQIHFHDQTNPISLEASGFTQVLTKAPILSDSLLLEDEQR